MKKILACLLLLIDHIGLLYAEFLPENASLLLRFLGSLALPLFAYDLAAGFLRSRSVLRYFFRVLLIAGIAETLLLIFLSRSGRSPTDYPLVDLVILLLSFPLLYGIEVFINARPGDRIGSLHLLKASATTQSDRFDVRIGDGSSGHRRPSGVRIPGIHPVLLVLLAFLCFFSCITLSLTLPLERGFFGIMTVAIFYVSRRLEWKDKAVYYLTAFLFLSFLDVAISLLCRREISMAFISAAGVLLCLLPWSQKKPSGILRWFPYIFYPLHWIVLVAIWVILF